MFSQQGGTFDWIENSKIDTLVADDQISYYQTITITAFDSGSYTIPPFPLLNFDSSILAVSNTIQFQVTTFPVDTTAAIKDIKRNETAPFSVHELWLYVKEYYPIIILSLAIIAAIIYLIIKYRKNKAKKKNMVVVKPKPKVKADVKALKALQQLRHKKLWEQGKTKAYYSELIDILRTYMEDRWEVYAMEMITPEILDALAQLQVDSALSSQIKTTLELSDLVKFAKCDPLPTEHDTAFKAIQHFVEKTKERQAKQA